MLDDLTGAQERRRPGSARDRDRDLTPPAERAICLQHVSLLRNGRRVLSDLDCSLTERRVALVGPNGSGKSSFLRLLNGLCKPSAGRVTVDGVDPAREPQVVRRRLGFVFQNPEDQIVYPVVRDDLAFGLRNLGYSLAAAREAAGQALRRHGLERLAAASVYTLSGGEKQLIALLGVLVTEPEIIAFDEPTTMLDLRTRNRLVAEIEGLDARVVVATHDLDLAAACERVLVMDEGRIVADDDPASAIGWYRAHLS